MRIEKWYADVVVDGRPQIQYLANLHLAGATIGYRGELNGGGVRQPPRWKIGGEVLPQLWAGTLQWPTDPAAGSPGEPIIMSGAWSRPHPLFRDRRNTVLWDPVVLNTVRAGPDGKCGRGYAECLRLEIAPWKFGLQTLVWGRFCGERESMVWIEWRGEHARKVVLVNGLDDTLESASRTAVVTANEELELGVPAEIVSDSLASADGALAGAPWIPPGPLRRFLGGVETKWVAEAQLTRNGRVVDRGYAIHEEVVWN